MAPHHFFYKLSHYLDSLRLHCAKTLDGTTDSDSRGGVEHVSTTSDGLLAGLALPDSSGLALDGGLSAEGARVLAVLGNLNLLNKLTEGSSVSDTVLSGDSNLLRALSHFVLFWSGGREDVCERNCILVRERDTGRQGEDLVPGVWSRRGTFLCFTANSSFCDAALNESTYRGYIKLWLWT